MGAGQVLVTVGTGFVGSAVVRRLLARRYRVRALVRRGTPPSNLTGLECELAEGDINDSDSLLRAMDGVQFLIHAAADYRLWARKPAEIVSTNVNGTRRVMEAAVEKRVQRIVYTSSVAVLKPLPGRAADENSRMDEDHATGAYKKSKIAAHRLVESMISNGLPAVIVSPSTPIGPRDIKPTPTGQIVVNGATGRMPAFVDTGLNLVHVDDVAEGHLLALEQGKIGENYILGGADVALQTMLGDIAFLSGRRAPSIKLPRAPLFPLAWAAEAVARVTGKEPFLTADALRMSRYRMFFSSEKARRELGYAARPYKEGLKDALSWFRDNGYLR